MDNKFNEQLFFENFFAHIIIKKFYNDHSIVKPNRYS